MTPNNPPRFEQRRRLLAGAAAVGVASFAGLADALSAPQNKESLLIGLDGHSLRGMRWKASQLIDYACIEGLDAVLLNGLHYFESLGLSHLRKLRELADTHGVKLYIGSGSIAAGSGQFRNTWGDAQQMLSRAIDVASVLGSAVVNVKIGSIEDRFLPGGIGPRIDEAIAVLKACQARAVDNGVNSPLNFGSSRAGSGRGRLGGLWRVG